MAAGRQLRQGQSGDMRKTALRFFPRARHLVACRDVFALGKTLRTGFVADFRQRGGLPADVMREGLTFVHGAGRDHESQRPDRAAVGVDAAGGFHHDPFPFPSDGADLPTQCRVRHTSPADKRHIEKGGFQTFGVFYWIFVVHFSFDDHFVFGVCAFVDYVFRIDILVDNF